MKDYSFYKFSAYNRIILIYEQLNTIERTKFDKKIWVVINCKILLMGGTEKQTLLLVGYKYATFA